VILDLGPLPKSAVVPHSTTLYRVRVTCETRKTLHPRKCPPAARFRNQEEQVSTQYQSESSVSAYHLCVGHRYGGDTTGVLTLRRSHSAILDPYRNPKSLRLVARAHLCRLFFPRSSQGATQLGRDITIRFLPITYSTAKACIRTR